MTTTRGTYSIGAVATATGLTTYTIRMWERRYGAVVPPRTPGRSRLYSHADVARLVRLRRLTEAGHAIRHIARLPDGELDRLAAELPATPARALADAATLGSGDVAARFLGALAAYDVPAAEQLLAKAALLLAPRAFALEVCVPVLDAIGTRWQRGELRVYQEHTASALLRATLAMLIRAQPIAADAPTAIVGTLTGESHLLGAMIAAVFAATTGWRTIVLDDHAPAAELLAAATTTRARAILLSFVGERDAATQQALDELAAAAPPGVALLAGGRTVRAYALPARVHVVDLAGLPAVLRDVALDPR